MEEITVEIGSTVALSSGHVQKQLKPVRFVGEQLASLTEFGRSDQTGALTDTRGVTRTLYKTDDGRYVVYIEDWSKWQGEPSHYSLQEVKEADLDATGPYAELGAAAGLGRPLTLAEALA